MAHSKDDLRADLRNKLINLEQTGYGDFNYTNDELDTQLELALLKLFPALYKRSTVTINDTVFNEYGSNLLYSVDPDLSGDELRRVYMVENLDEYEPILGWRTSPSGLIVGLNFLDGPVPSQVAVHYYTFQYFTGSDSTPQAWGDEFRPLIVLGALIECLDARQDRGVRPDPPDASRTPVIDGLRAAYERLKDSVAMSLPVVML